MTASPRIELQQLSRVALEHANVVHGIRLQLPDVADVAAITSVDQILLHERSNGKAEVLESLVVCYGAWWGEYLCALGGQWFGCHEPVAPRVVIAGLPISPMDAVRRILTTESITSLHALTGSIILHRDQMQQNDKSAAITNRSRWDQLVSDPRFVNPGQLPPDRTAALSAIDPWLQAEQLDGKAVLCLCGGGGTHGPLFAIAGAQVTVVDFSEAQLAIDREIARQCHLDLRLVCTSADQLDPLGSAEFDIVVQPVSSSYLPRIDRLYHEVARILKPGGLYVVQHKQPYSLVASTLPQHDFYALLEPIREGQPLPDRHDEPNSPRHEQGTVEYVHTLDSLIGELCRAGFIIEDLSEPIRADVFAPIGTWEHRCNFLPPYLKLKARRR